MDDKNVTSWLLIASLYFIGFGLYAIAEALK